MAIGILQYVNDSAVFAPVLPHWLSGCLHVETNTTVLAVVEPKKLMPVINSVELAESYATTSPMFDSIR